MNKETIILDTDVGDDIDDAFALTMAVHSNEITLVGVTTVFRNSDKRAKMTSALLKSLGADRIPVYAGIDKPLIAPVLARDNDVYDNQNQFIPCQYSTDFEDSPYEKQHAVDFIIETINENPGQITLVAIGPLTNIAVAIRKSPGIINKVKKIVLMGGYFTKKIPEWNILCDPEAANIVFSSGISIHAVGLDVTLKCSLNNKLVEEFKSLSHSANKMISTFMEKWFKHFGFEKPVLHDPLTIATLINSDLVKFEKKRISIGLNDKDYGQTHILDSKSEIKESYEIFVATDVDSEGFLSMFKECVFGN